MRDRIAVLIPHLSTSFVGNLLMIAPGVVGGGVVGVGGGEVEGPTGLKITGFGGLEGLVGGAGLVGDGCSGLNVGWPEACGVLVEVPGGLTDENINGPGCELVAGCGCVAGAPAPAKIRVGQHTLGSVPS